MNEEGVSREELFAAGIDIRRAVLGDAYVDASIGQADEFMLAFQRLVTETCWGYVWPRPGLDRRMRSLLNLALLMALKAPSELKLHVKGALRNGATVEQIRETLLHATVYCGVPAGLQAFKAAHEALIEAGALPPRPAGPEPPASAGRAT